MSDPDDPQQTPAAAPTGPEGGEESTYEAAAEHLRRVVSWYNERILAERRAEAPDRDRLEQLIAARNSCADDRKALEDAGPEDVARIAAEAEERFTRLTATEQYIAGGLGLLAPQYFGGAPVLSALLSAGCVAPEERGARLSVDRLAERLRHLREQGAVISTLWTTSSGYVRRRGWEDPVSVFAWSITTDDLKRAFTRSGMPVAHGRTKEADELQRHLARQWNGPVLRLDWWPAWLDGKQQLTTYRFGPSQSPAGLLSFNMKRSARHGMELTVHDFWAADAS
ncbi:GNAT family N-acetyltransferase [Streptomyces sp. CA-288835]|uniref:GNAT family N-acetyltransferase n=1 Tax=Streptomyces sp. CA-288835 TaxID=3240069 RepID=UPI003D8A4A41